MAAAKATVEIVVASTIDGCLRWRSMYVPKAGPRTADEMLNAPAMTPVTTTERVCRYTQNVRANHRNELVTPLTSELTRSRRNVCSPAVSGRVGSCGSSSPTRSTVSTPGAMTSHAFLVRTSVARATDVRTENGSGARPVRATADGGP